MLRYQLVGPMSGITDFNRQAFNEAEETWSSRFKIINPAKTILPEGKNSWEEYMKVSISQLVTCDGIILLQDWDTSKGAQLEQRLAHSLGMDIKRQPGAAIPNNRAIDIISESMTAMRKDGYIAHRMVNVLADSIELMRGTDGQA